METTQDAAQVLETEPTESTTETVVEATTEKVEEDIEAIKAKAAKADELESKNKQLYERLKKAEVKTDVPSEAALSNKDLLYLAKADIHEDDMDDVLEIARLRKVSVADAHKFMKPILADRAEERKTATVTQSRGSRGSSKVSGEDLLTKAEKSGEVPESEEGLQELFKARMARRFSK